MEPIDSAEPPVRADNNTSYMALIPLFLIVFPPAEMNRERLNPGDFVGPIEMSSRSSILTELRTNSLYSVEKEYLKLVIWQALVPLTGFICISNPPPQSCMKRR